MIQSDTADARRPKAPAKMRMNPRMKELAAFLEEREIEKGITINWYDLLTVNRGGVIPIGIKAAFFPKNITQLKQNLFVFERHCKNHPRKAARRVLEEPVISLPSGQKFAGKGRISRSDAAGLVCSVLFAWATGGKERDEARSIFAGLMENHDIFEGPGEVFGLIYLNLKDYEAQYTGDVGMSSKPKSEAAERYLFVMEELGTLAAEYGYHGVSLLCSLIGAHRCRSLGMGTESYPFASAKSLADRALRLAAQDTAACLTYFPIGLTRSDKHEKWKAETINSIAEAAMLSALEKMPGDPGVEKVYSSVMSYLPDKRTEGVCIDRTTDKIVFKVPCEVAVVVAAVRAAGMITPNNSESVCSFLTEVLEIAEGSGVEGEAVLSAWRDREFILETVAATEGVQPLYGTHM